MANGCKVTGRFGWKHSCSKCYIGKYKEREINAMCQTLNGFGPFLGIYFVSIYHCSYIIGVSKMITNLYYFTSSLIF